MSKIVKASSLTWEEFVSKDPSTPIITHDGTLVGGPDRRNDQLSDKFRYWQKDCQFRAIHHNDLHPSVMVSFQAYKHLSSPPNVLVTASDILPEPQVSFVPPKWSWSFSALNTFNTCPLQYAHKYYYKTIRYKETAATKKGNEIHASLERYCKGDPSELDHKIIQTNSWMPFVNAIMSAPGEKHFELEMGLTELWKPIPWRKATGRCKGDVIIINGEKASYIDWKTGENIKDDPFQLKLSLLFIALHFPQVKVFNGKFIWLAFNKVTGLEKPIERKELLEVYDETKAKIDRVQEAWESQVFPANKSGLCRKYCEVKSCPHCGK